MSRRITAQTRIAGVVGNPARHSLSPVIHNAWIEAAGLDGVYLAFEPAAERFDAFIEGLRGGQMLGLNVTTPFKARAFALADSPDADAKLVKAANLLRFTEDGRIEAGSTDGRGQIAALQGAGFDLAEGPVVVLGAGGAARSIVHALLGHGVAQVRVVNRTLGSAMQLVDVDPERVTAFRWTELRAARADAAAIINATSLGMEGQAPLPFDLDAAPVGALIADIVYHPLTTPVLAAARARGHRTVDGLDMLIGQAAPSFEALFGRPPPAVDVRALCEAALAERP